MFRTYNREQKFETAFDALIALKPDVRIYITATPVPALLALREELVAGDIDDIDFWSIASGDEYIGLDKMVSPVGQSDLCLSSPSYCLSGLSLLVSSSGPHRRQGLPSTGRTETQRWIWNEEWEGEENPVHERKGDPALP